MTLYLTLNSMVLSYTLLFFYYLLNIYFSSSRVSAGDSEALDRYRPPTETMYQGQADKYLLSRFRRRLKPCA